MYRPCVCRCYSSVLPPFLSVLFGNGSILRSFTTKKKEHILSASYGKKDVEPVIKKGGGSFFNDPLRSKYKEKKNDRSVCGITFCSVTVHHTTLRLFRTETLVNWYKKSGERKRR